MTYNIVVDGIFIAWGCLISEMVRCAVNAEHEVFLERPSGNVARKLFVPGFLSAERKESQRDGARITKGPTHEGNFLFT